MLMKRTLYVAGALMLGTLALTVNNPPAQRLADECAAPDADGLCGIVPVTRRHLADICAVPDTDGMCGVLPTRTTVADSCVVSDGDSLCGLIEKQAA